MGKGRPGETYNVGGDCERTNRQVVDQICAGVDAAFRGDPALATRFPDAPAAKWQPTAGLISFVTDRPGHDRRYAIDIAKIQRELGFVPQTDFASGLHLMLKWYLDNEPWWRALQERGAKA